MKVNSKKYILVAVFSIAWMFFWLAPYILGALLCSPADLRRTCSQGEGLEPYWYGYNFNYSPASWLTYRLYDIGHFYTLRYFSPTKFGIQLAALACIPLGWGTYIVLRYLIKLWRNKDMPKSPKNDNQE